MAYSKEDLRNAVEEVKSGTGVSIRGTAQKYGIPRSTLHDHISGRHEQVGKGGPTVLTSTEEREIALTCMSLGEMGFGLTRDLVEIVLFEYIKEQQIPNPFPSGIPGRDWWQRFMKRWPCLSERKPQHLSKSRAKASHPEIINGWFDRVEELARSVSLDFSDPATAQRLWNCDETGLCTAAGAKSLLVKRGSRQVSEVSSGSDHEYITIHCAGCASGEQLPPFILYKGKNMYRRWMVGGPAGALYGISESGWMDPANFLSWFLKLFLPAVSHLTAKGPVLLFFDGHYSHISLELIRAARQSNVHLLCLPPNTTHILQPLDVGAFSPLKNSWRKILKLYKLQTKGQKATKETFPSLIAQLWESLKPEHCKGGFRGAGLFPLSRQHVLAKLPPSPALVETEQASGESRDSRQQIRHVTCDSCGHEMPATPLIKTHLTSYFTGVLQIQRERPEKGKRNNMKIRLEGETVTSDEFLQILEEQQKEKEEKKKGKKKKAAEQSHEGNWFIK